MGKKSAPPPPDYTGAAREQAEGGKENLTQQTWANRANQVTPWGSTSWEASPTTDPSTGQQVTQWTERTQVDPRLQGALDSQLALQQGRSDLAGSLLPRAQQEFSQPIDTSGAVQWSGAPQAQQSGAITQAFGFGGPRQQRVDTSRQATPGLDTSRLSTPGLDTSMGSSAGDIQTGLDFSGTQGVSKATDTRSRAEDAIYGSAAARLDPQWSRRQQSLESDLANRGITMNSDAYSRAMSDFNMGRNDAYGQAQRDAITAGGAEASRDFGMDMGLRQQQVGEIGQQGAFTNSAQAQGFGQDLQAGQANNAAAQGQFGMDAAAQQQQNAAMGQAFGMGNTARQSQLGAQQQAYNQSLAGGQYDLARQQQAFTQQQQAGGQNFNQQLAASQMQNQLRKDQLTETLQQRGYSLNEINALISGQQVGMPQFNSYNPAGVAAAPQLLDAANMNYQGQIGALNAQNAGYGQLMQAGATAAAAYFMSDRRVKTAVRRIGKHARGFGIYAFRYIGERGRSVGVIAQEVRRFAPELVRSVNGVLQVNYAAL